MRRDILLMVVALVAFAGSAFAGWGTAEQRDRDLRGYANPTLDAALPYYVPKLGVNADLRALVGDPPSAVATLDRGAIHATLDAMTYRGIYWVRQVIEWDEAQAAVGAFDYTKYDVILNALRERNDVELVAVLNGGDTPPQDMALFATWAREFALRYGDVIDVYQVWDEPNLITSWSPEPRAEAYAALLQASYEAIHSADADATVLTAALAPTLETGPDNISDLLYLDDLYRLGLSDFSDGIAAKPYGFSYSPAAEPDADVLNFRRVVLLREIMQRHGDGATALWASEFGWNHLPDDWAGEPSIWGEVSAEQQAAYTLEALALADNRYAWMGGAILASWQPNVDETDARWGFALIGQGSSATALGDALYNRNNTPRTDAAPIGLHHPTNPFTSYSGVWTLSERGADIGWVGDSQLTFTFRGNAVSLLAREGDYTAYLYMTIDGAPANALTRDADGNSYLLLTSDTLQPETRLIPLARGLGDGVHVLRLAADRGWDRWALAGFAVGGVDRAEPYNRQIALAGMSAGVAGLAAVVFGAGVARGIRNQTNKRTRHSASLQRILSEGVRLALGAAASVILLLSVLLTWTEATPAFFRREPIQLGLAVLTAGLLYVNPALPLAIAAAAVLFLLLYQRPLHGLALTIFYTPFFLFPVELFRFAFPMSELLVLITFAAWGVRGVVTWAEGYQVSGIRYQEGGNRLQVTGDSGEGISDEPLAISDQPLATSSELRTENRELRTKDSVLSPQSSVLDLLLVAYLLLGIVSLAWTEYRGAALTELRTLFVEPCLFYAVLRFGKPKQADVLRLVDALVLSGIVVAVIGLFLFARGDAIITAEEGARRLASVYGSPNNVGLWLGRCLPFALAFALLPLDRWRRLFGAAAVVIFVPALLLTQSAGALFVGVPVALVVTLVAALGRRAWLPLGGIAVAGAVALPLLLQSARFARLLDPTEGTNFFRLRVWQSAVAMIRDAPLTGLGQDQFLRVFRGRYILPDAWQEPNLSHPHNIVLDFWLRLGVLGVVLGVALHVVLARLLVRGLALARAQGATVGAAIAVGALGCLANQIAHGMVDNSIFVNDLVYVFVLLAGLGMYLTRENDVS